MEDMHIHIRDGINNMEELKKFINEGIKKNIDVFLLLEHGNRISNKHIGYLDSEDKIDIFKQFVNNVSKLYNNVQIYSGIEIDYSIDINFRKKTLELIKYGNFDYVIGSIHSYKFNDGKDYFKYIIDMIKNYPINIIGHIILRDNWKKYKILLKDIISLCGTKKIKIEINTSDRSRWNNEQLEFMLKEMNNNHVLYCFGSDAHSYKEVGYKMEESYEKVLRYK